MSVFTQPGLSATTVTPRGRSVSASPLASRFSAALLVEYQADDQDTLTELTAIGNKVLAKLGLVSPGRLESNATVRAQLWKLRKGLYASVAGARPLGTTALLEDIVVPVQRLAATCESLRSLFDAFAYRDARRGGGAVLIEAKTYRRKGHAEHDDQRYVPEGEVEWWETKNDPVARYEHYLLEQKIATKEKLEELTADVLREIEEDCAWAESSPLPDPEIAAYRVYDNEIVGPAFRPKVLE